MVSEPENLGAKRNMMEGPGSTKRMFCWSRFTDLCLVKTTLPETNIAPENGWLEYDRFLLGWPIFRCELLVSGSVSLDDLYFPALLVFFWH